MDIKIIDKKVLSTDNIHQLSGKVYIPDTTPKGILHIVHGMTEHIARYEAFMRDMASDGYVVFGYDNLGHGYTANDESELGFIAHKDGWDLLAKDVKAFSDDVRAEYGTTLPYYLLGHSMGSFIVRVASEKYLTPDKLVLMGTGAPNPASSAGIALSKIIKFFKGEKHVSKFIHKMAFGAYNKRFDGSSSSAWLTKDTSVTKKYLEDPFCTFKFSVSAMQDLITLNKECNRKAWFSAVARKMPILIVSGAEDPVGDYGKGVETVYNNLRSNGADVELKLYENCRHEILNDTCKAKVIDDIKAFLKK